jgi:uncharacterized protein (TIGR02246 family)
MVDSMAAVEAVLAFGLLSVADSAGVCGGALVRVAHRLVHFLVYKAVAAICRSRSKSDMRQEVIVKRYLGLISLLVLAATVHTISSTAFGVSQDEASVRAIPQKITEAWNNGKEDGIAGVYAHDGTLVAGHGVVLQGRAQIARYHDEIFATAFKATRLTVKITSVRFLDQDVAIMQTEGGILWPGETELAPGNRGIQSFIVVKQDGAWQIVLFQNTRVLPVAQSR